MLKDTGTKIVANATKRRAKNRWTTNLRAREKRFCCEYVTNGFNATNAAIAAGYLPKVAANAGYKLLQKDKIVNEIERLQDEYLLHNSATVEMITRFISNVALGKEHEKVIKTETDKETGEKREITADKPATLAIRMQAADMLLKLAGAYINKQEITVTGQIEHYVDAESERDLVDRLAKRHGYQTITAEIIQDNPALPESTA